MRSKKKFYTKGIEDVLKEVEARKGKWFFYYPNYNKYYHRRVVVGLLIDGQIIVTQSVCFPGKKGDPHADAKKALLKQLVDNNVISLAEAMANMPLESIPGDMFIKAKGREIAQNRAFNALNYNPETMMEKADPAVMRIEVPAESVGKEGKLFVERIEAVFPARVRKEPKALHNTIVTTTA